ncbi:hypothetical protein AA0481_0233 [Acetobacter orientalis NRIC 0481]|nr:hypothetical protein AA0481_0233 [Acetobacter orientalis NRIC 0481]
MREAEAVCYRAGIAYVLPGTARPFFGRPTSIVKLKGGTHHLVPFCLKAGGNH